MNDLSVAAPHLPGLLRGEEAAYYRAGLATNTARSYRAAWRVWQSWCAANPDLLRERDGSLEAPSEGVVVAFAVARAAAGIKPQTIEQNLAGIAWVYKQWGRKLPSDGAQARMVLRGIRRKHGARPVRKAALTPDQLARMTAGSPPRDRAFLLLGFAGAFRRSELADLKVGDLAFGPDGLVVTLRRSKGDRAAEGVDVTVGRTGRDTCPVGAVERWLAASGRAGDESLFGVCGDWIAQTVKRCAERVGIDPDTVSGHSLRAGLITAAVKSGVDGFTVSGFVRHKDPRQTLGYVRDRAASGIAGRVGL